MFVLVFSVSHHIYGIASTINSANYAYFLALEKILTLGHPDAPAIFTEQLLELHRGQGIEIYWRDSYKCPTEEEYRIMVIQSRLRVFVKPILQQSHRIQVSTIPKNAFFTKYCFRRAGAYGSRCQGAHFVKKLGTGN